MKLERVIEILEYVKTFEFDWKDQEYREALDIAIMTLKKPEYLKGEWIVLNSNEDSIVCKCPICGEIFTFYNGEYLPNYCGDCGSDMRCSSLKGNDIGHSIIDENQA